MKITPNQAAHILMKDNCWSYNGALALCEYLGDMELDVVAIRCEFSEYPTAWDAAQDYGFLCKRDEDELEEDYQERGEEEALEYLQKNTTVLQFDGGIIVERF